MLDLDDLPKPDPAALARVKQWVRSSCRLPEDVPVLVTELRCREEGCPPVETVIAVMFAPGLRWQHKLHKPAAAIAWHEVIHCGRKWDEWAVNAGVRPHDKAERE